MAPSTTGAAQPDKPTVSSKSARTVNFFNGFSLVAEVLIIKSSKSYDK
jgi:hypothetical protein